MTGNELATRFSNMEATDDLVKGSLLEMKA